MVINQLARLISSLIIAVQIVTVYARNANEFYTFKDARATSTYVTHTDDLQKFGPARAFQIGASYWCSAGNHASTDFVSWTGELWDVAKISQIDVIWEYAPNEVEISTSMAQDSFNVVMPFRKTFESKPSYKEVFKLDAPVEAKFVRLTLRGPINEYFGIREVHIVGAGNPLFVIKSGISSPLGEMCLQLEEGRRDNNTRVILDLCTYAIAAADGRDLWRHDSRQRLVSAVTKPPKCLTSVNPNKIGPLVIADCKDDGDDQCRWEFLGNGQISLKNATDLCMTQSDVYSDKAGMGDLLQIMKKKVKLIASSTADRHKVESIMDENVKTYWASNLFLDSGVHTVTITIDFGEITRAAKVRIDWEYQPVTYTVEGSTDNIVFKELARNMSNADHVTIDTLEDRDFKQLRLVMLRPHHTYGKVEGGYVYGIRQLQVLSSNLETVVGDCRAAANTPDARDKYFVSYVSAFEPALAHEIKNMENEIHGITGEVIDDMATLGDTLDETDTCMQEKKEYDKTLEQIHTRETAMWKQIQMSSLCSKQNSVDVTYSTIGETMKTPAEDCYSIKQQSKGVTSGFFWIQPQCSKHPLRVYCDMGSQTSMLIWDGKNGGSGPQALHNLTSPQAIRYQCAAYGLEPLIIKSKHQVDGLREALFLMGFERKADHYIPLAYKFGNAHKFRDLMNIYTFMTESSIVGTKTPPEQPAMQGGHSLEHNAAGLSLATGEIEVFDLETANIAAIVCSTNVTEDNVTPIPIKCDDRIDKNEKLVGNTNTNIVVSCSEHCADKTELPVYGTDGVYSDRSSICRAAIHAGVIANKGTFTVSIETGLPFYSGSTENGIQSYAFNKSWQGSRDLLDPGMPEGEKEIEHTGPPSRFSIRILPRKRVCPIVQTHGSFLQVPSNTPGKTSVDKPADSNTQGTTKPKESDATDIAMSPSDGLDMANLDPTTKEAAVKVLSDMNAMYGLDIKTVINTIENIAAIVSRAKKYIKPLESVSMHQEKKMTTLYDRLESALQKATYLKESSESQKSNYQRLLHEQQAKGVESEAPLVMDYTTMAFSRTFKIHDTSMTSGGQSRWGYSDSPFDGHMSYIVQSSDIDSSLLGEGAYAMLKDRRYFDFDITVDLLAKNEGSVGIAFRSQGHFNYYLLLLNSRQSNKQLLKVQEGVTHVLATNPDDGYKKNTWIKVNISATGNLIEVTCDGKRILKVLDTSFLHGGVGLYSCGSNGSFYFDNFTVTPKPILMESPEVRLGRLKAVKCSTYNETYTGDFSDAYKVVNPSHAHTTSWRFKDIIGGKHKAIHQYHISQDPRGIGSLAILNNDRTCTAGFIGFRFLPMCEGGSIGAVVRFANVQNMILIEMTASELSIRLIQPGGSKVLGTVPASYAISKWNAMQVGISSDRISVKVKKNVDHGSLFSGLFGNTDYECKAELEEYSGLGLGIGLKSAGCDSCYFDQFHVSPEESTSSFTPSMFLQQYSSVNIWRPCAESVHVLNRIALCKQMFRNRGEASACAESFCFPCCSYHTRLLGEVHREACMTTCQKNHHVSNLYLEKFLSYVNSCVSLEGPAFKHCEGDRQCLKRACSLCCSSGHDEKGPLDKALVALETSSCLMQCNTLV
ncbi:LCCL domain family protein [Babesia bovis T2Bo]|uniref:LCCL domain containing protein n=1 Tax=Babesia bovis TaxID=5865 RepID=A7ANR3_BABBO|nr:LCCL domain family protein [Babesia bovis T2Bo]EDO08197.1 LCCL domain family protein [Babesia bovis T2Bo]|eukprot:XP_001611765.1 LCCL domain containing protein [Babesia bovis T2Bo]